MIILWHEMNYSLVNPEISAISTDGTPQGEKSWSAMFTEGLWLKSAFTILFIWISEMLPLWNSDRDNRFIFYFWRMRERYRKWKLFHPVNDLIFELFLPGRNLNGKTGMAINTDTGKGETQFTSIASQPKLSLLNPRTGVTLGRLLGYVMAVYIYCSIFCHFTSTNFERRIDLVI